MNDVPQRAAMVTGFVLPAHAAVAGSVAIDPTTSASEATDGGGAWIVLTLAVSSALIISFLCSIFESVLLSVSRGHVETMVKSGNPAGKLLRGWKKAHLRRPISAILILNTFAHTIGATVAGSSYESVFDAGTLWIFSLAFTFCVLIFTEIIPKTLGVAFSQRLAAPVTSVVRLLTVPPFGWLVTATEKVSNRLTRNSDKPVTSIEEIRLLAALGSREGDVGPRIASFIDGIANLRELTVHDVMVPRGGVSFLSGKETFEQNLETVRHSGHSRFPFTATGDLDEVTGVIMAKDLLFLDHDSVMKSVPDWQELKTPPLIVPEGKRLDAMLRDFQEQRKHLALVVNEYGGTQGVVTLEDVLEEIVGEIEDETDRVEPLISKRPDGMLICRGWAEMRKLLKTVGIDKKADFVTLGGFLADKLGRVPKVDDEVVWQGMTFKVLRASKRRAELVQVDARDAVGVSSD